MGRKKKASSIRKVPIVTKLPPRSKAFETFETSIKTLNDFVHGSRAAWATADLSKSPHATKVSVAALSGDPKLQSVLHEVALVYAVATYEVFLKRLIVSTLSSRDMPKGRVQLSVSGHDAKRSVHEAWAETVARSAVSSGYADRPKEVRTALKISHDEMGQKGALKFDIELVNIACLARHCIVHDGGSADASLVAAAKKKSLIFEKDAPLSLTDSTLWRLVGALKKHARALDVMVGWHDSFRKRPEK